MSFAEISKYLRKEHNISQSQLAKALKVSSSCIAMIEVGKNEPTANTLARYADFFECSTDYLLGREDDFGNIKISAECSAPLPKNEQALLDNFRKLPDDLQRRASAYMEKLVELVNEETKTTFPPALTRERKAINTK